MTTDDKQTVTEDQVTADTPDEAKEAEPEAAGAQDTEAETDWDALLGDSQTEPAKAKPEPDESDINNRLKVLEDRNTRLEKTLTAKETTEGLDSAVGTIKADNDELKGLSDGFVRGFIYQLNEKHPQLEHAFADRHANPKAWAKALTMIGKEMKSDFAAMPDADLTEGVKAAADAVRGVSTQTPAKEEHDNKFYAKMTDAEFEAQCDKELEAGG